MSCEGGGKPKFTKLTPERLAKTVAAKLIPVADNLRDLQVRLGLRTYQVRIVKTRWSGGFRGEGVEEIVMVRDILPTPLVGAVGNLGQQVQSYGLTEDGTMSVSEISGRYTEPELMGWDESHRPPSEDEQVFWEVEYAQVGNQPARKRRFLPITAPSYDAESLQWTVTVTRSNPERSVYGELN